MEATRAEADDDEMRLVCFKGTCLGKITGDTHLVFRVCRCLVGDTERVSVGVRDILVTYNHSVTGLYTRHSSILSSLLYRASEHYAVFRYASANTTHPTEESLPWGSHASCIRAGLTRKLSISLNPDSGGSTDSYNPGILVVY